MKRYFTRVLAKASILALAFSSVLAVSPVRADAITSKTHTLTRHKTGVVTRHSFAFTLPSATSGTLTIKIYSGDGTTVSEGGTMTGTCAGGGTIANINGSTTSTVSADLVDCNGAVTITSGDTNNLTATNPSAGTYITRIYAGGTDHTTEGNAEAAATHSGNAAISIVDDDQVTVTATVAETMTFDLDTGTAEGANNSAPYTVDLGTLPTSGVATSGDGTINRIGVDLDTNASGGAVVQVRNLNGTDGLKSTSVPGDFIPTISGATLDNGSNYGYGLCVNKVTVSSGSLNSAGFHAGGTLTTGNTSTTCTSSQHQIATQLNDTFQDILETDDAPIAGGRAEIFVKASINSTVPAHDDYTDTLTFRATATF